MAQDHLRFHVASAHLQSPFGNDAFGKGAEGFARFFGTPRFLVAQSIIVVIWIVINAVALVMYDPYPFILLNLAFSLQAAYAAPLILLAQTRQADRDKAMADADARHREDLSQTQIRLLQQNTDITVQVADLTKKIEELTREIHERIAARG
jgi:uncharacterized membrane protein